MNWLPPRVRWHAARAKVLLASGDLEAGLKSLNFVRKGVDVLPRAIVDLGDAGAELDLLRDMAAAKEAERMRPGRGCSKCRWNGTCRPFCGATKPEQEAYKQELLMQAGA